LCYHRSLASALHSPFPYLFVTVNIQLALITISTRASLKRYHTYTLILGNGDHGDEWEFQRIGTESEKSSVEKELVELREKLAKVEEWKKRKEEIDEELGRVWVEGGEELGPPAYAEVNESPDGREGVSETERGGNRGVEEGEG
jgi:ATP-binding cassette, subfamily D (ALD), peroxisomal long-chain fatty acid import protein